MTLGIRGEIDLKWRFIPRLWPLKVLTMVSRFDCKYSILRKFKSFLTISHTDDPLWTRYWGVMKNDKLNLWLYPSDEDVKE